MARGKDVKNTDKSGKPTQVPLDGATADALREVCRLYRRDQKEVVQAAVMWLLEAGEDIAGPILNYLPKRHTPAFARLVLTQMAEHVPSLQISDAEAKAAHSGPKHSGKAAKPKSDA